MCLQNEFRKIHKFVLHIKVTTYSSVFFIAMTLVPCN